MKNILRVIMTSILASTALQATQYPPLDSPKIARLDEMMHKALETFQIPGCAIGIVVDGQIALTKGYGLRHQQNQLPVTENTLFAIGSCTKAFGACVLAQMAEEELLSWRDPVLKYLPDFRLKDVHATHHLTIRDAVTHCSGLPRHDFVWYNSKESRREIFSRLAHIEPSCDLREKFQYNNLLYIVSALVMEAASGQTWEDAVHARIFSPLGMNRSNCSVTLSQQSDDFSLPYSERNGKLQAIPFRNLDVVGPAGAINSCAKDMAKWVQWHLSDGSIEGKRLLKQESLKAMHLISTRLAYPVFNTPEESPYLYGYGLGWMTGIYKGRYLVTHGGAIDGFMSCVVMFPNEKVGVVILTNSDSNPLFSAYAGCAIADFAMGAEDAEWIEQVKQKEAIFKVALQALQADQKEGNGARPASDYVGEFENPGYGSCTISLKEDALIATYNGIEYVLEHKNFDHFFCSMQLVERSKFSCSFLRNASGDVSEFLIRIEPTLPPISFKFKADRSLMDATYLNQFIGEFIDAIGTLEISLQNNRLYGRVSGQSAFELIPARPNLFTLKGVEGVSTHFSPDAAGNISQVSLIQPNGTFVLKKRDS